MQISLCFARLIKRLIALCAFIWLFPAADICWAHRLFTYTYEPEQEGEGETEITQWVTLAAGRSRAVGQQDYQRFDLRTEIEYGVTRRYSTSLYLNSSTERFHVPGRGTKSGATFNGVSLENRYQIFDPATHPIGLTLYAEPRYSGPEFEMEEKIILGQNYGDWKVAFNLSHSTDWQRHFREHEGELEFDLGVTRILGRHAALGMEFRNVNEIPGYQKWENTVFFAGPVLNLRTHSYWATFTVLPQIYGRNFLRSNANQGARILDAFTKVEARLIAGFEF